MESSVRRPDRCHMRGNCGKKSIFGADLPCPVDDKAQEPSETFRQQLVDTCGADYAQGLVCCTSEQVENLGANLQQAEALISSCPACRNNFRSLFCAFTCSPNQAQFLDVVETQQVTGNDGKPSTAVKTVEYYLEESWKQTFFDSCKDVKFGASNGFAMDLIGGGAQDPAAFLSFLGQEKPLLGSPFQINFPDTEQGLTNSSAFASPPVPFSYNPRKCSDPDLLSRCACVDCPDTCAALPPTPGRSTSTCKVGALSCFAFTAVMLYAVLALVVLLWKPILRRRAGKRPAIFLPGRNSGLSLFSQGSGFERVRMDSEDDSVSDPSRSKPPTSGGLVGSRGLGHFGEEVSTSTSASDEFGRGVGLGGDDGLSALAAPQPRKYPLNRILSRFFYHLGLLCASHPWLTFAVAAVLVGAANMGWKHFEVETDPVALWVAPGSVAKQQQDYFDQQFGPFYRPQQIFLMDQAAHKDLSTLQLENRTEAIARIPSALTWDRLLWLNDLEHEIANIRSEPSGITLQDICLAPAGPGTPCVVQSILGYFQDDPIGYGLDEKYWEDYLNACATNPVDCLPTFGQPLKSNIVLGAIPESEVPSMARAAVVTYVLNNSLNQTAVDLAEEWERALLSLLKQAAGLVLPQAAEHPLSQRRRQLGLAISFSTGVSLEQEIGSSSNTDVGVIILSYLTMFVYAALTLGGRPKTQPSPAPVTAPEQPRLVSTESTGSYPRWTASQAVPRILRRPGRLSKVTKAGRRFLQTFCVSSKFTLGLFGILIVLISVSTAVGIFSAMGVKVTLIIAEVIPFMLLAVGVDNIFLLCNEMDRQSPLHGQDGTYGSGSLPRSIRHAGPRMQGSLLPTMQADESQDNLEAEDIGMSSSRLALVSSAERAARALARMGPSILLSATTQIVAFLLGALVPMPAVRNFALYAAGSMFIVAILHCTVFVAAMALDADRTESGRVDCIPCIKTATAPIALDSDAASAPHESTLDSFIKYTYAPALLRPTSKKMVALAFTGLAVLSCIGTRKIEMGLDQRLALPATSYLRPYFDSINVFLDVGPPVYFVASDKDAAKRAGQRGLCGRFTTCEPLSLANTLEGERRRSDISLLAEPASSWIDDFLQWLNPVLESCCRVRKRDPSTFCGPNESEFSCQPCFLDREPPWNITMEGLPENDEFYYYLEQWLISPTDESCPLGGQAAYSSALNISVDAVTGVKSVQSSHFRTYFSPLRSQSDFIEALEQSQRISDDVSARVGFKVFAYSLFFIFFEQYTYLRSMAVQVLGSAAVAIFAITTLLLGSWRTGAIVTTCVSSAVLGVAGTMGFLGIQFNALTLVNLSVCAAIGVEFCAHIARAFMRAPGSLPRSHPESQKERDQRAWAALSDVGSAVVSGIFSTKLIGVAVLIFTKSDLLKLYYAKTWLSLIIGGLLHGLILLPVLLSWLGGRGWSNGEDENDVKRRLNRAGSEYRPVTHGEPEDDDDQEEEDRV